MDFVVLWILSQLQFADKQASVKEMFKNGIDKENIALFLL